ncbi:universal stress protein [Streptomyces spiroverticillatus]|uniref:Universal stress protein n=1 Tax=Streptomyces finlayi TaxID=67296 RepID=A0A918WW23_9ACTN|nr:universal stress protein [Streptomyces finlayi]GHA05157.1 universal stress protein [Streptomyces spiroverticillatus]GHC89101.1 universal stress protein [Streptomyces finlayi]
MELPLIVGVDGSESSLQAVDWAADEAARRHLPLRLVHASRWESYESAAFAYDFAGATRLSVAERTVTVAAARATARQPGVKVATAVLPEDAESALLHEAHGAAALITGSRGLGPFAELLLGSVSLAVAARAVCPVVVVRGDKANRDGLHGKVLVGVKAATPDQASLRFALDQARTRACTLQAVTAWRSPAPDPRLLPSASDRFSRTYEQQAAARLDDALHAAADHPGLRVDRTTVEGPAHKVLRDLTATADLLVLGAHHRRNPLGLQLGATAHALLHHAHCPVVVVPHTAPPATTTAFTTTTARHEEFS